MFIIVDTMWIPEFSQIQINSHADRDDATKQEHYPEVKHQPVTVETIQSCDHERDSQQEKE